MADPEASPVPDAPLDLLAIGAHPDDVEISCGGTLALAVSEGLSTGILDLTQGELGTNGSAAERACEAREAQRILGVVGRWNAGLPDGGIQAADPEQARSVASWIRRLRPAVVLTHAPIDRHPDHVAASSLVDRSIYLAGLERFEAEGRGVRPRARYHFASRVGFDPSIVVDISMTWEIKRRAILAHASQIDPSHPGASPTLLNAGDFIQRIEARARHYGGLIGVRYGEPFRLEEPLGIPTVATLVRAPRPTPGGFTG